MPSSTVRALAVALLSTLVFVLVPLAQPMRETPPVTAPDDDETLELADPALVAEVVAREPLIQSPVAITFDEHGRLFVVEMIDYPHDRLKHPGRISLLEDSDDDGTYDRATVFADDLPWPSGAFSYDGGLYVTASPDLLYLKDTNGDGRADQRRVVYTGFGNTVPEPMPDMVVNGFAWGLDNRLYGATSRNGGQVSAPGGGAVHDLRGRDFSIDPRSGDLREESGGGQFGVTFDAEGRRFVSSNANHLMQAMYEARYAAHNPWLDLPRPMLDIPADGPSAPVFRLSPDETWRVLRTQWRTSGKVRGLVEYGGKASGYFTSACSPLVYQGDALPTEYAGSVFVAEPANNLVHRKVLNGDGVALQGVRPPREADTEFLRSASVWFRPVNMATGPDGALYVVDMHRFVVEDPKTIPPEILAQVDARAGSGMGRIYRVGRKDAARTTPPRVADAAGAELAGLLAVPNGWTRDTASRLIYERQDMTTVPTLERLATTAADATVRVRALYALQGLGRLTAAHVRRALDDTDPAVRVQAVRLAEPFAAQASMREAVLALARDASPRVRYQVAFTLGALPAEPATLDALTAIVLRDVGDPWIRTASLTALNRPLAPVLARLAADRHFAESEGGAAFLGQLLRTMGARGERDDLEAALAFVDGVADDTQRLALARELVAGVTRASVALATADPQGRLSATLALARRLAADRSAAQATRLGAVQLLEQDPDVEPSLLLSLLAPGDPQSLQIAALAALRSRSDPAIAATIVARWPALTPRVRQEAIGVLLARPERALRLLEAIRDASVARADLSAGQAQALLTHPDPEVARMAGPLLALGASSRDKVVEDYRPALALPADAERGRTVFAGTCASCHRLDGVGVDLGPNLLGVRNHGREGLVIDIFDPNRKVDPAYLFYEIERSGGETLFGAVVDESATAITVAQAYGARTIVPRDAITRMRSVGTSMMPEGLEESLSLQQVADLLAYLLDAPR